VGQRNMARFRQLVDPYTFRVTKSEIGILPKSYDRWHFDMTLSQKRMMKELRRTLITKIDSGEIVNASNALVATLRLQQISNGFVMDDDKVVRDIFLTPRDNPRVQALTEYLDATEGKVVIWARFQRDIENIMSVLGNSAVAYYGPTSDRDRAANKASFMSEDGARYFVSNPQAGGTGLDGLQNFCQRAVYYSNSENSIDRWQSEDRTHRIGTNGSVIYTDLVAKGSMDARILANHRDKKALSDMSLGDIREWLANDDDDDSKFSSINFNEEWPDD
jgi:SNF2 family DNA or RNA helicase